MCFRQMRQWDERAGDVQGRRLWDVFYRETERSEPPMPVAEHDEDVPERDRDEVPVGAEH